MLYHNCIIVTLLQIKQVPLLFMADFRLDLKLDIFDLEAYQNNQELHLLLWLQQMLANQKLLTFHSFSNDQKKSVICSLNHFQEEIK